MTIKPWSPPGETISKSNSQIMVSFSVGFFHDQKHLQAFEAFVNQFKIKKGGTAFQLLKLPWLPTLHVSNNLRFLSELHLPTDVLLHALSEFFSQLLPTAEHNPDQKLEEWCSLPLDLTASRQKRMDRSDPQVTNDDSVGECSNQRGAPTWFEGNRDTISPVRVSHTTTCTNTNNSHHKHCQ